MPNPCDACAPAICCARAISKEEADGGGGGTGALGMAGILIMGAAGVGGIYGVLPPPPLKLARIGL